MYKQNRKIMKNLLTLTYIFIFFLGFHSVQADIIIVNNNEGHPTDMEGFNDDLGDAIQKAASGDTLYLVGSATSYGGNVNINKQLTIIGPGYFLARNNNVNADTIQTQANLETAQIGRLTLLEDADGSIITGIDFSNYSLNTINIKKGCHNVKITRNKVYNLEVEGTSTLVTENYILGRVRLLEGSSSSSFRNNIILGQFTRYTIAVGITSIELINNTLGSGISNINNADIDNNIFINDSPLSNCFNNTFRHNVFTVDEGNVFPEALKDNIFENQGNKYSADRDKLFRSTERTIDADYQLALKDSPAEGAGLNDVDAGAFTDEASSYKRSGLPAVPAIYEYTIHNGVGTAETGIKVTIKAKSHN